jgi:hypothetical protein
MSRKKWGWSGVDGAVGETYGLGMATLREIRNGIVVAGIYDIVKGVLWFLVSGGIVSAVFWWFWEWIKSLHPLNLVTAGLVCSVALEWAIIGFFSWKRGRRSIEAPVADARKQPYNRAWENGNAWSLWQIACLWVGVEPALPIRHTTPQYPILKNLEADIKLGQLNAFDRNDPEMAWWLVTRQELTRYVNERGSSPRPSFLFPNG